MFLYHCILPSLFLSLSFFLSFSPSLPPSPLPSFPPSLSPLSLFPPLTCSFTCTCLGSSENDLEMRGVRAFVSCPHDPGPRSSGTDPFFLMIPKPGKRDFLPCSGAYCVLLGSFRRTRGLENLPGAGTPLPSLNIVRNTLKDGGGGNYNIITHRKYLNNFRL